MSRHYEFSVLTPEAYAAYAAFSEGAGVTSILRMKLAAFLREAITQADPMPGSEFASRLAAIAANLHAPHLHRRPWPRPVRLPVSWPVPALRLSTPFCPP